MKSQIKKKKKKRENGGIVELLIQEQHLRECCSKLDD